MRTYYDIIPPANNEDLVYYSSVGGSLKGKLRKWTKKAYKSAKRAAKHPLVNNDIVRSIWSNTVDDILEPALDNVLEGALGSVGGPLAKKVVSDIVKDAANSKSTDEFKARQKVKVDGAIDDIGNIIKDEAKDFGEKLKDENAVTLAKNARTEGKNASEFIRQTLAGPADQKKKQVGNGFKPKNKTAVYRPPPTLQKGRGVGGKAKSVRKAANPTGVKLKFL